MVENSLGLERFLRKLGGATSRRLTEVFCYIAARAEEEYYGEVTVTFKRGLPVLVRYGGTLTWEVGSGQETAVLRVAVTLGDGPEAPEKDGGHRARESSTIVS